MIAGFAYPPPAIVPFVVLAKLPLGAAFSRMTLAIIRTPRSDRDSAVVRLPAPAGRLIHRRTEAAVTAIAIALGPSYMNAMIGQVNALVLAERGVVDRPVAPAGGVGVAAGVRHLAEDLPGFLAVIGLWDRRAWRSPWRSPPRWCC